MAGLDILPFHELYEKVKGAKPSGKLWDMYLTSLAINTSMQRLLVLPPGAPQAALDALRAAVHRLNDDKDFAADALKVVGFVPEYSAGPDTNAQVGKRLPCRPRCGRPSPNTSRTGRRSRRNTMPRKMLAVVAAAVAILRRLGATSPPAAEDPFYKGKRLTLLINFAPGGPTDIEGRLFARHIVKHIDGNPTIVVQNKDGAGGLVGTVYLGELGPKDGTMVGYLTGAAWNYVVDPKVFRVDFRTYRVHRLPARQRRLLRALRYAARHARRHRHHEGARDSSSAGSARTRPRTCCCVSPSTCSACSTATSPAIAAATRRGSPCRTARSTCIRKRRRPISASSSRAW